MSDSKRLSKAIGLEDLEPGQNVIRLFLTVLSFCNSPESNNAYIENSEITIESHLNNALYELNMNTKSDFGIGIVANAISYAMFASPVEPNSIDLFDEFREMVGHWQFQGEDDIRLIESALGNDIGEFFENVEFYLGEILENLDEATYIQVIANLEHWFIGPDRQKTLREVWDYNSSLRPVLNDLAAASSVDSSETTLEALTQSLNPAVRLVLTVNPAISPKLLALLAQDSDQRVRKSANEMLIALRKSHSG